MMWTYWRDKKGILEAVKEQYPYMLASSPHLQFLVTQAELTLGMIDNVMSKSDPDKENS